MVASILKWVLGGALAAIIFNIFYLVFGQYLGFALYHFCFAVFYLCQSVLDPITIKLIIIAGFIDVFAYAFKKINSLFSF